MFRDDCDTTNGPLRFDDGCNNSALRLTSVGVEVLFHAINARSEREALHTLHSLSMLLGCWNWNYCVIMHYKPSADNIVCIVRISDCSLTCYVRLLPDGWQLRQHHYTIATPVLQCMVPPEITDRSTASFCATSRYPVVFWEYAPLFAPPLIHPQVSPRIWGYQSD